MDATQVAFQRFQRAARAGGLSLSAQQLGLLARAAEWLAALGHTSGVSGYESVDLALIRAMGPALAYLQADAAPRRGRLADIGAGNGAIGATIAILEQNLMVDLVDRAQRAYTACEILAARLGIANLRAIRADVRALRSGEYDGAVFRALARGERALPLVRRVVRPAGFVGAFHRADDAAFGSAVTEIEPLGSWPTLVGGLVLTGYRI
ncbi:MAG TPA: hypothetical protein ENN42_01430 [Thioalkalivibrio sp.]|nr:hypothetical protein [Thioalkalivibrio sp.]